MAGERVVLELVPFKGENILKLRSQNRILLPLN